MCLTIVNRKGRYYKNKPKPFIAEKPIKVYKILGKGNYSPYRSFRWKKGYNYYETTPLIVINSNNSYVIEKGLHSYVSYNKAHNKANGNSLWSFYTNRNRYKVVEMIIPKGASYFLGDNGDIVSDKLNFPDDKK